MSDERTLTRQERRERRLTSKRERIPKHGASLGQVYANAVLKRARKTSSEFGVRGSESKDAAKERA